MSGKSDKTFLPRKNYPSSFIFGGFRNLLELPSGVKDRFEHKLIAI